MELTGLRIFWPGRAKSGRTKRASLREVSATKSRSAAELRRRRRRWTGNEPVKCCIGWSLGSNVSSFQFRVSKEAGCGQDFQDFALRRWKCGRKFFWRENREWKDLQA